MGRSRIEITVTGNHGCNRKAQPGEALGDTCANPSCVDCRARDFAGALKAAGNDVEVATLTHWPDDPPPNIVDDLKAGTRQAGAFGPPPPPIA